MAFPQHNSLKKLPNSLMTLAKFSQLQVKCGATVAFPVVFPLKAYLSFCSSQENDQNYGPKNLVSAFCFVDIAPKFTYLGTVR